MDIKKVRIHHLSALKQQGEKIVMLTAYDFPSGWLVDQAGVEVALVGDSLGNTVLGFQDTLPVTMEHMLHHVAAVRRGVKRALLVADMPFMTARYSPEEALRQASRFFSEAGAEAVKIEGGTEMAPTIRRMVEAGLPVMGHLGLTPQSVHGLGGYRVQGRGDDAAARLLREAKDLQEAGCFCIVLECVPEGLAGRISGELSIPAIGIGAGAGCDGQVLVFTDMLGLNAGKSPKFVKQYAQLGRSIRRAVRQYGKEVKSGAFPGPEHTFKESS